MSLKVNKTLDKLMLSSFFHQTVTYDSVWLLPIGRYFWCLFDSAEWLRTFCFELQNDFYENELWNILMQSFCSILS